MFWTLLTILGSGFKFLWELLLNLGGIIMAGRSGTTVINININSGDDVFDLLGKGLVAVRNTDPITEEKIDVRLGGGLHFDELDGVEVNAGDGLEIDDEGRLNVAVGDGLVVEDGKIAVTSSYADVIGDGLTVDEEGRVVVDVGDGIELVDGKVTAEKIALGDGLAYDNQDRLIIDNSIPGPTDFFTAVSDIKMSLEMGVLILTKIITTYAVSRSKVGTVVSVSPVSNRLEQEKVTIGGGPYSYGVGALMHSAPDRAPDANMPNFYKK